jgi:integrase
MYERNGYYYTDFVHDGKRYVKSLKTKSKSVAKELERKFRVEVESGKLELRQQQKLIKAKFNLVLTEYLETESIHKKSHRRDKVSSKHLLRFFGKKTLIGITPDDISNFKLKRKAELIARKKKLDKNISEKEVSLATVNRELASLKRVFNWYASQKRLTIPNPVKGIEFFKEKARDRVMTEEEEKLFFTIGNPPQYLIDVVLFALATGARKGEILNLKKSDVILGELGGSIVFRDTKNGENRKVVLTKELTEFLKKVINVGSFSEHVFCHKNGQPLKSFDGAFRAVCNRAGIKDFRFHDLRHTFCTRMASEGVNPFMIMQIVGHKDTTTAKRYTNPTDEHLLAAMGKMSHQFSQHSTLDSNSVFSDNRESKVNIDS